MTEDKLNDLAVLSIEADIVNTLNFDNLIDEFSRLKARRKAF